MTNDGLILLYQRDIQWLRELFSVSAAYRFNDLIFIVDSGKIRVWNLFEVAEIRLWSEEAKSLDEVQVELELKEIKLLEVPNAE